MNFLLIQALYFLHILIDAKLSNIIKITKNIVFVFIFFLMHALYMHIHK
jgi:hypothetical protein